MKRLALVAGVVLTAFSVFPSAQVPLARPVFLDGQAQIVPAFQDASGWIRQTLWVETEFDSDGDGKRDRMFVDVTRQKQTDTEGLKVPVIYESSPYFSGTSGPREFLWNVKQEVGAVSPPRTSQPMIPFKPVKTAVTERNELAVTWVPRGFAVVRSEAPGTGLSQGCATVGGEPEEKAPKAVIDWLNGRAKGFSKIDGTVADVVATWTTGKVGMTGTSYNGTIPVAAATTGVKGLEAIIPVAPNTSYYHYYRSNGLVRHPGGWLGEDIDFLYDFINSGDPARRDKCNALVRDGLFVKGRDRQSGDYNNFWAERDLLTKAAGIKAAVLMAHAFNDWNVVPEHSVRIALAVRARGIPVQFYFHQGGHGGPPPLPMMNRWFSRYLYGINNNVEGDPKSMIVRESTGGTAGTLTPYANYPNPEARPVVLYPLAGGAKAGELSLDEKPKQGSETLVDNVEFSGAALAKVEGSPNRLIYATPELAQPVHISGFARITVRVASSKPAANLSVWLVQLPWTDGPVGTANLITRGWADPQNAKSLLGERDYHAKAAGTPLKPGQFVELTFALQPDDQIIPAGKRIALMIMSSDKDFTLWPAAGTELTIDLDHTQIELPIVGGAAKLGASFVVK